MHILTNHIGYYKNGPKNAVLIIAEKDKRHVLKGCFIINEKSGEKTGELDWHFEGRVDNWKDWLFYKVDFSKFEEEGSFYLQVIYGNKIYRSRVFSIRKSILLEKTIPLILSYFRAQHCSGEIDRADISVPFEGSRRDRVDVHGGWYDASGDTSKYLSHLSYANYMNPQQTPLVVWNMLAVLKHLKDGLDTNGLELKDITAKLISEAAYGADFLVRMQDDTGYFYTNVFDRWSKSPDDRRICSFKGQNGERSEDYQAGYRQGGGMAIAALARAFCSGISGEYKGEQYLKTAVQGFEHLEEHNKEYLDDGKENIIDDYCALLASAELYSATGEKYFLNVASLRAVSLSRRVMDIGPITGWFRSDDNGIRPFFHASDAGLPLISLLRYLEISDVSPVNEKVRKAVNQSLEFELAVTNEVSNPFGYARQYIKPADADSRTSFFMPHNNETGYWWQGENARLASLASSAISLCLSDIISDLHANKKLREYAVNQLNWILGLNPYDVCMMQGIGHNNPEYEDRYPNKAGGICNGITAGIDDESDIDFLPKPYSKQGKHRWRWSEQWLPHSAWFMLAAVLLEKMIKN
ncbi:MAG: glycoside hydrolase family 9 protein [Spirochaetales bacterium]|nr:glycoside hydrolase family 9 protein [Spirochaetales bacterium]